jgi:RNA polymerase sigma-70 factor (ECF subfamily)
MKNSVSTTAAARLPLFSEQELIAHVLRGHPPLQRRAQRQLIERYDRLVRSILARYLQREEDIEEATQDTFLRAFSALAGFRNECKLSAWLSRVAVTTALNRLRQGISHYGQRAVALEDAPPNATGATTVDETQASLQRSETRYWIGRAITHLSDKDQTVIDRFYLREQSIEEIREATGWSATDIKSRLCRARRRLREVVEQHYAEELA